jgi:hypothetical protein
MKSRLAAGGDNDRNGRLVPIGGHGKRRRGLALPMVSLMALLGGCGTSLNSMAPTPPVAQISITTDELVGKWGLASYRVETDLKRTQEEARRACSNPYVISKGAAGGVMMHLADKSVAEEVFLKTGSDGRIYLGPHGKAGDRLDRQIVSSNAGVIVTQWVDPAVATRYGTMVFVRCAAS